MSFIFVYIRRTTFPKFIKFGKEYLQIFSYKRDIIEKILLHPPKRDIETHNNRSRATKIIRKTLLKNAITLIISQG